MTLGQDVSREAKRLVAALLEVLGGQRTPQQAAQSLGVSVPRYYQVEARALRSLLAACEPKPKGRQPDPATELAVLRRRNEQLQRDLARQQALVRLAQRAIGLSAPPPAPAKVAGKKTRKRRPTVRALAVATRLRQDAEAAEQTLDGNGLSSASA
jgi:hypothetical protein